jgi:hypothetical protein
LKQKLDLSRAGETQAATLGKAGDERSRCLDARAPIPATALQRSLPDDMLEERHAQLQKGHKVAV